MNHPAVCLAFAFFWLLLGLTVLGCGGPKAAGMLFVLAAVAFAFVAALQLRGGNHPRDH